MTNYLLSLPSSNKLDREQIGGKAFALNKLLHAGFNVPKTLVLPTTAMSHFVRDNNLETFEDVSKIIQETNKTPEEIRAIFTKQSCLYRQSSMKQEINDRVTEFLANSTSGLYAVRSSANCEDGVSRAWAGQFNSFLNVKKDDVIEKIKVCWGSVFSPGVYYYYLQDKNTAHIEMAVVLQEMVPADVSGVGFSVNPISKKHTEVMIEYCNGLGEPLVGGKIIPSMCVLNKDNGQLIECRAGRQKVLALCGSNEISCEEPIVPSLSSAQQESLAIIAVELEKLFGTPQDFEWAIVNNEVLVLQSRNITT